MKFLHTADWQLGKTFGFEGEGDGHDPSAALAQARFDAVGRIAELATAENADAVLVAGDVFEHQGVSDHSLRRMARALEGFAGRWVLLPGNHDAALADSVWSRFRQLGLVASNVTLALEPEVLEWPDLGVAILPAPLRQKQTHDDLTAWFDTAATAEGLIRIGLAHGSIAGVLPEAADSPNPIAPDRATRAGLGYLALGDWHGLKQIDARTWYSGTPEPDRFKANDPGHVLVVEMATPGASPQVTPRHVGRYRWQQHAFDLHGNEDLDALAEVFATFADRDVLRLAVRGSVDLETSGRLEALLADTAARVHALDADLDAIELAPTDADLAALQFDGALGDVVAELRARQQTEGEDADTARLALKLLFDLGRRLPA